jgi:hypothetical protein
MASSLWLREKYFSTGDHMSNSIVGLARMPGHLDVFSVDSDGRMSSAWWHEGQSWLGPFSIGGFFPPGGPVAAVARFPEHLDVFAVGKDGRVYISWWPDPWNQWSGVNDNWLPIGGFFPTGAHLAAVARMPEHLDVFAVGNDGHMYMSWWQQGQDWSGVHDNWLLLGGAFPPGASVAAVARMPGQLDVFAVSKDGRMYQAWWHDGANWSALVPIGGFFPAGAPVAAVARMPEHLDVFAVGNDGHMYMSWWQQGQDWSGVHDNWLLLGGAFPPGASVAAVARLPGQLDVFAVGTDGRMYHAWWHDGANWSTFVPIGGFFPPGAPCSAVARLQNHLDVFAVGNDGQMYSSWWHDGSDWSGVHDNWMLLHGGPQPRGFEAPIITGGLAALGGWCKVTIYPDGSVRWQGEVTNTGIDSYDYAISAIVRSPNGPAIALAHSGSIPNRVPIAGGTIRRPWNEIHPPRPLIAANFGALANAQIQTNLEYSSDIGSALEKAVGWLIKWGVGTALGPVGAVIFIGVEIGSLISTGSLVPGARVVGGVLWMAGPTNTLFAIAAEGIATLGSRPPREITQEEYDWANAQANDVFMGALPPRDMLVLTDTIGAGNRPFTFPRFDNMITLNMGPETFDNPRNFNVGKVRPRYPDQKILYGEIFIHELVHACQIYKSRTDLSLLADALSSKVCEAVGDSPYIYDPAGFDFVSLNLEQQAQIFSDWFAGAVPDGTNQTGIPKDINSPYFRYVSGNVRIGLF